MARDAILLAVALTWGIGLPVPAGRAADPQASSAGAVAPKQEATASPEAQAVKERSASMFPIKGDQPLSIRSDELEAIEDDGRRRLLFTRNVNVEQGDLRVRSERLEAFYPPGGSQPDRLTASGSVRVSQRNKTMLCDAATYYQSEDRLVCTGNAELRQGSDRVRGKEIEIFVKTNRVKVKGGAIVNVAGEAGSKSPAKERATP